MEENKMKTHVTAIGIIQLVFGILNILGGLSVVLLFSFVEQFIPEPEAVNILQFISTPICILLCMVGALMVIGAIGLLNYKGWGRIITLVMGGLGLINIPIGTLKGVYIIWALVQPETARLFTKEPSLATPQQN